MRRLRVCGGDGQSKSVQERRSFLRTLRPGVAVFRSVSGQEIAIRDKKRKKKGRWQVEARARLALTVARFIVPADLACSSVFIGARKSGSLSLSPFCFSGRERLTGPV